jgi:A/G-specific adenine glycosylase
MMLQQTQVATVVPYFENWLQRFPDVVTVASAPLGDVLKAWEGLGYYSRARNLHRAAQEMVKRHGGEIPGEKTALLALPGIGRYTAGAILSLAFGHVEPVLDGNVRRVLCRVYDISADPHAKETEETLWDLATGLVEAAPDAASGDLNEAIMELGALICTARRPACAACPLAEVCLAYERTTVAERPARRRKMPLPHFDVVAGAICDERGRFLLIQRPPSGLLGGLWGFPGGKREGNESLDAGLVRTIREQVGIVVTPGNAITRIAHAYTHFRITLHAFRCEAAGNAAQPLQCAAIAWVAPAELSEHAFPVTDRKVIEALGFSSRPGPAPHPETSL